MACKGMLEAELEAETVIDVLHVGDILNYTVPGVLLVGILSSCWRHSELHSAWGSPRRDPGDRIRSASRRDKSASWDVSHRRARDLGDRSIWDALYRGPITSIS